jgi:hypothetical protein
MLSPGLAGLYPSERSLDLMCGLAELYPSALERSLDLMCGIGACTDRLWLKIIAFSIIFHGLKNMGMLPCQWTKICMGHEYIMKYKPFHFSRFDPEPNETIFSL